jgi:hypothetical protein
MSEQSAKEAKMQARKAGQSHDEERDTTHPKMVTELLISILRGVGRPVNVEGIEKKTREEVIWGNSLRPWRRSPLWLLIRVSLQLTMGRTSPPNTDAYKTLMACLMTQALQKATES